MSQYHHIIAEIAGTYPIKYERIGKQKFRVTYGLQVKEFVCLEESANEFKNCLLHLAQCEGMLDDVKDLFDY